MVALVVKNLPANAGLIPGLGRLEEVMATYSSILAWRIPWIEEPGELLSLSPWGCTALNMTEAT